MCYICEQFLQYLELKEEYLSLFDRDTYYADFLLASIESKERLLLSITAPTPSLQQLFEDD